MEEHKFGINKGNDSYHQTIVHCHENIVHNEFQYTYHEFGYNLHKIDDVYLPCGYIHDKKREEKSETNTNCQKISNFLFEIKANKEQKENDMNGIKDYKAITKIFNAKEEKNGCLQDVLRK